MKYQKIIVNTDGGSRGNPGPAAIGITAQAENQTLFEISEYLGTQTNNVAEYTAVLHALKHLSEHQLESDSVLFILDSELIVRQINGQYRVKNPQLQILHRQVGQIIEELRLSGHVGSIIFQNVLRHENRRADQLVNQALDSQL